MIRTTVVRKPFGRELLLWRLIAIGGIVFILLGFAQDRTEKEIRLSSADGKQSVVLSGEGIKFMSANKTLGRIEFDAIGDGEQLALNISVPGGISARSGDFSDGKKSHLREV